MTFVPRRVRIGPCVYLLALRHPTIAAKAVASLDVLVTGLRLLGEEVLPHLKP